MTSDELEHAISAVEVTAYNDVEVLYLDAVIDAARRDLARMREAEREPEPDPTPAPPLEAMSQGAGRFK